MYSIAPEQDTAPNMSPIASLMFLGPNKSNGTRDSEPRKFLSLTTINKNLGDALKIAAKGYLSGYICTYKPDALLRPEYSHINQSVMVQHQQNSLISNAPFVISLSILDAIIVLILVVLLGIMDIEHMRLFNLKTLEKVYGGNGQ